MNTVPTVRKTASTLRRRLMLCSAAAGAALLLGGCAAMWGNQPVKQVGSLVDYLYPDAKEAPRVVPEAVTLRPPVRVGIAFVPGGGWGTGLPEPDRQQLLNQIRDAFGKRPYIGGIEVIPSAYLRPRGGFANLEQVARMFNVDEVVLLSYDQVQFNDTSALSMLYWTIVGAYVIKGDRYDIQTLVDASVFDVQTHRMLFRAPGTSQVKGNATMTGFSEAARNARLDGYRRAVDDLIPHLDAELESFRNRIRQPGTDVKIENRPGYSGGGGGASGAGLLAGLGGLWAALAWRRRGQRAQA